MEDLCEMILHQKNDTIEFASNYLTEKLQTSFGGMKPGRMNLFTVSRLGIVGSNFLHI